MQTHFQLKIICEEYNSLFVKNEFYPLQKAYTTPHFLVLVVRFPGKTKIVYIGRGNQYQGIYLSEKLPPSYLRVQDRLLDYVRKYLVGSRIGKLEGDAHKMIFQFSFKNDHTDNIFLFGYKARQLFFAKQAKGEIYLSWTGETLISGKLEQLVDSLEPDKAISALDKKIWMIEDYLKEEEKKIGGIPIQRKREKFLIKKINNILGDLKNAKEWKLLQKDLNDDRLDLSVDELKIYGQKIKLHGLSSSWLRRDAVFKKIKKLKKAEEILDKRLEESQLELKNVQQGDFDFGITKEKIIQPMWRTGQGQLSPEQSDLNIKKFKLKNLTGVIGLDAISNDGIRAQASKDHFWFHIENHKGSHCIVKTDDFSRLSQDDIEGLASMLRDFSGLEILEIPIIYSQLKNIKGVKGSAGKVIVKKPKHLRCIYRTWKEIISIL